jgi:probable HAF family extracellular repeat protein
MHGKVRVGTPRVVLLAAITLIVAAQAAAQAPPPPSSPAYTITNLGTLCTPDPQLGCESAESVGLDVNTLGQVVGTSSRVFQSGPGQLALVPTAFRTGAGQPIDPSTDRLDDSASESIAFAINDSGQVVGNSVLAVLFQTARAFIFTATGPMMFLPGFVTCSSATVACNEAFGINNSGAVVGSAHVISGFPPETHAFRLTSVLQDLGTLSGLWSAAYGINDFGLTVGAADDASATRQAVVFGGLSPIGLGTLGGSQCGSCERAGPDPTSPTTAQIVGTSDLTATGPHHAFVLQLGPASPGMQDLGALCTGCDSTAFDINNLGHIVGESEIAPAVKHAFLYKNNQMTDLNSLLGHTDQAVWDLTVAHAINDLGQIAGTGRFQGQTRAFLMTPPLGFIVDNMLQLVAVVLNGGPSGARQSLMATLEAADAAIERNQAEVAGVQLNAYEQQVRALAERGQLTGIHQTKLLAGAALIRRVMEEEGRR